MKKIFDFFDDLDCLQDFVEKFLKRLKIQKKNSNISKASASETLVTIQQQAVIKGRL